MTGFYFCKEDTWFVNECTLWACDDAVSINRLAIL